MRSHLRGSINVNGTTFVVPSALIRSDQGSLSYDKLPCHFQRVRAAAARMRMPEPTRAAVGSAFSPQTLLTTVSSYGPTAMASAAPFSRLWCVGASSVSTHKTLTPHGLMCRCLYEIGSTPPSKLQLLTNGFNEKGARLLVLPRIYL